MTLETRRFSLLDAMSLLAATAIGMILVRLAPPVWSPPKPILPGLPSFLLIQNAGQLVVPFLAAWTIALLFLRFRRPRPRLRLAFRQPGTIACATATMVIMLEITWGCGIIAAGIPRVIEPSNVLSSYTQQVSFAILGGWTGLAASGLWRKEASWIDRAGRAIGAAWIAVTAIHFSSYFVLG